MALIPKDPAIIIQRARERGELDVDVDTIYAKECEAAQWSRACGLYIIWAPHPSSTIPASAADDIRSGSSQCCRIGESSYCGCGHPLSSHSLSDVTSKIAKYKGRNPGYLKPPACCQRGCNCKEFRYVPCYPEECGQWWLRRRKDFNIVDWRKRVRSNPDEYACVGCNLKVTDHETLIETRDQRLARHPDAKIDEDYYPLDEYRTMGDEIEQNVEAQQSLSYPVPVRRSTSKTSTRK